MAVTSALVSAASSAMASHVQMKMNVKLRIDVRGTQTVQIRRARIHVNAKVDIAAMENVVILKHHVRRRKHVMQMLSASITSVFA